MDDQKYKLILEADNAADVVRQARKIADSVAEFARKNQMKEVDHYYVTQHRKRYNQDGSVRKRGQGLDGMFGHKETFHVCLDERLIDNFKKNMKRRKVK
jgi:hypothetical protein